MLVSGVQQSDSVIYIHILFHILFHYGLLRDIEYSSLRFTYFELLHFFKDFLACWITLRKLFNFSGPPLLICEMGILITVTAYEYCEMK